jgi:hypothetical protein
MPIADTLRVGLAADADILTSEHVAAKACGDELLRDILRALPVLQLSRRSLVALAPEPNLEAEERRVFAELELRLMTLVGVD